MFILIRPKVVNSADIIKMATIFIKVTFKDLKKFERIKSYELKCDIYICIS